MVFYVKSRVKTWQVRRIWSQQFEHKQVPKLGTEPGVRKGKLSLLACHTRCKCSIETTRNSVKFKAKEKYRVVFKIQKSGDKTSSGEIGLDIRTHASPKVGQDQVSGGVSVLCWHATPVAYVLWKPRVIKLVESLSGG